MLDRPQNNYLKTVKPGEIRNPAGRPKGSRNKLGEDFVADLYADWQLHGRKVMRPLTETEQRTTRADN
jgi:hypothetical protein